MTLSCIIFVQPVVMKAAGMDLESALVGLREQLFHAIPATLKNAIAVGIGLLIAVVGFEWSGMIVDNPGTLVGLGQLSSAPVLLSLFGITVMAILLALEVRAAILLGILATMLAGRATGMLEYQGLVGPIPSITPTLFQLDVWGALQAEMVSILFIFFFLNLFDTVGTLIGITQEAGLLKSDGTLPRARWAFLSDAVGTTVGLCWEPRRSPVMWRVQQGLASAPGPGWPTWSQEACFGGDLLCLAG